MLISYVLPVHNCEDTIANCLESLINQSVKGEIIVIDDASTDHTAEIISYYLKDLSLFLTNKERLGAAKSRNLGNNQASGDVIAVCDVDFYYKNRGKAITEFFKKNKDKSVFYSALNIRKNNDIMDKYLMEAYEWDFKSKCPISHPTVAYRRKVIDKVSYHEKSIETDLYEFFLLDAHKAGFKFGGCQNPLMMKVEGNSLRNTVKAKKLKKKMYKEYGIKIKKGSI